MAGFCNGRAQMTVKKDVAGYFSQLPAPPATLVDAYNNCHCRNAAGNVQTGGTGVAPTLHDSVLADAKSIGTLTTTQDQQVQQAKATANRAQADNFNGMNKDQQLSWVQNNMQGYGNTAQAAALAQKLQNPTEVAKFKAMTPAQKLEYLQANGIDPMKSAPGPSPTTSPVAAAQAAQQQMQQNLNSYQAGQYTGTLEALLTATGSTSPADAQQRLLAMDNAYNSLLGFYRRTDSAYGQAMIAANFGYTGDAGQDKAVNELSAGQILILEQVIQLEGYLNRIYQYGAMHH